MITSNNQLSFNLLSKSTYIYSRTSRNQQEDLKKQFTASSRKDHGNLKKKTRKLTSFLLLHFGMWTYNPNICNRNHIYLIMS